MTTSDRRKHGNRETNTSHNNYLHSTQFDITGTQTPEESFLLFVLRIFTKVSEQKF